MTIKNNLVKVYRNDALKILINMELDDFLKDNKYLRDDPYRFDKQQVLKGLEDEYKEHYDESIPDIKKLVGKIVIDHLIKDPKYYDKY